jgi:pimeloyl-ACP methyl ester carboxylesterase
MQRSDSAVAESHVAVDGDEIRYLHAGESGTPVVLLHGGGVDAAHLSWEPTLEILADGHRVFAPDLPGYGGSDAPDADYSMNYFLGFLDGFLDRLDLDAPNLVGLSMGGGIALGYALRAPERVGRLVLVDSYGLGSDPPRGTASLASPLAWSALRHNRALVRWGLGTIVADRATITDGMVATAHRLLDRPHAGRAFRRFYHDETGPGGVESDFSDRLPELAVPTLLIHGEDDDLIPLAWARRARDRIPNARLSVFENCGHWPPREKPDEFVRVVGEFLAESPQSNIPVER